MSSGRSSGWHPEMREHRLFCAGPLAPGQTVNLPDTTAQRIRHVLRWPVGQVFTLFDGSGYDYTAELVVCNKKITQARTGDRIRQESPPTLSIQLALGILRGERMDFSLQKAVELGVNTITPLFTRRTLVQLQGTQLTRREAHWQGVIRHACEQSGRSLLPAQQPAQPFASWCKQVDQAATTLLLDPQAKRHLTQVDRPAHSVLIAVGPEGGLTSVEREQAVQHGFTPVRLGPRILRAETAPLAALAAIQTLWGDYREPPEAS
ncbi:MAG: 16S rRNA (uracil(1498)-N(3))-methyltransferase [Pseudomonadota bacterium]